MKCALISVGTELLIGQTINTNVAYIAQHLNLLGIDVLYHHTVGDNPDRLKEMVELSLKDCDLVITTGGLGPTQDDLTKEMCAEVFGYELEFHEPSYLAIKADFDEDGIVMTENNKKQAYLPKGCTVFANDQGTAPGFIMEKDGKYISCIPGPPREMKAMFHKKLMPYLETVSGGVLYFRDIRTYGIGESALETKILDLIKAQSDPTIATYAKETQSFIRVASKHETLEEAKAAVEKAMVKIRERLSDYIYSEDGEELQDVVSEMLLEKNISISCAESCTGGMFASTLVDYPDISKVFDRGIVTYSNKAKTDELGVNPETIEKYGAVSEETAAEMVEGLEKITGSDICIAITGVAGPGESEGKPAGLAYIGYRRNGVTKVHKRKIGFVTRKWNRQRSVMDMFSIIYKDVR